MRVDSLLQGPMLGRVDVVMGNLLGIRENWGIQRRALNLIWLTVAEKKRL